MISLTEAHRLVDGRVQARAATCCTLSEAAGLVLATPVVADRDLPATPRSAMDGYAFCCSATARAPLSLEIRGEIPAGVAPTFALRPGECARIFTGASLPNGADTVAMQENSTLEGTTRVRINPVPKCGANVLQQGENARAGVVLLHAGQLLTPVQIGLCATIGQATLQVIPKPRVAVLNTGEELLDVTANAAPHQIRDSNGPMIAAQLQFAGFSVSARQRVADHEEAIAAAAQQLLSNADVLLITGGVSVGNYDFVPAALQRLGAVQHLHGVAVKPGKPQLFATLGEDKYIFGLPGNPISALVGLLDLVLPALRRLSGQPDPNCRPGLRVRTTAALQGRKGQHNFLPAQLTWSATGPEATPVANHGSADLVGVGQGNGFLIVAPDTQIAPGDYLDFLPWGTLV